MSGTTTRGVLFVHSTPAALCPHVEWAVGSVLDTRVTLEWTPQPAEEPSPGADGSRWSHTPGLGIHHAVIGVHGDALVGEDRLRSAVQASGGDSRMLLQEVDTLLGKAWDEELEPFRYAGAGAPVRRLHRVG
jgi:hypothetical protein